MSECAQELNVLSTAGAKWLQITRYNDLMTEWLYINYQLDALIIIYS